MTKEELEFIVQSNARAIQSLLDLMVEERLERREREDKIDAAILKLDEAVLKHDESILKLANLSEGVVRLLSSLDEDRPTILRKLNTIENKLDKLLEDKT